MVKIVKKRSLNPTVTLMELFAPLEASKAEPGQFVILRAGEKDERIPLTIADFNREKGTVTILFQVVGAATWRLNRLQEGEVIRDFVGPLEGLRIARRMMKAYMPDSSTPIHRGGRVAVVGGGNVAMDAARCARRLGAEVTVVYRRTEKELPARLEEVDHAKEEGVVFQFLTSPIRIAGDEKGWVNRITCQKTALSEPDESGRARPVPLEGSEEETEADCVIMAIGTSPNPLIKSTTAGLDAEKWGGIIADEETGQTSRKGVFAGGDAVTGAATVILAMGAGKKAAEAIDAYITGGRQEG